MSLIVNILKVRKAFSNPEVPHNPKHSMHIPDLKAETGLSGSELAITLENLQRERVVEFEAPSCVSVTFVHVTPEYRELMGVLEHDEGLLSRNFR